MAGVGVVGLGSTGVADKSVGCPNYAFALLPQFLLQNGDCGLLTLFDLSAGFRGLRIDF